MHVSTNIGKIFFNLINKHFGPSHLYHKIFNKNTIKISYSCMPNMQTLINKRNQIILSSTKTPKETTILRKQKTNSKNCNCRKPELCPLDQNCLTERVIYKATVATELKSKTYIGSCETSFKTRFNNHKQSFKNLLHRNDTVLSTYIWELKEENMNFKITWKIILNVNHNFNQRKKCNLCLTEKVAILKENPAAILNTRSDILSKCRHRNKFKLKKILK